jgi:hypothetical protein
MSVQTTAELPGCDSASIGFLYYVESSQAFKVCKTTGWTSISIQGPQGIQGAQGMQGPSGPQGSAGTSPYVSVQSYSKVVCSPADQFIVSVPINKNVSEHAVYRLDMTAKGDVTGLGAACSIMFSVWSSSSGNTTAGQMNAATQYCAYSLSPAKFFEPSSGITTNYGGDLSCPQASLCITAFRPKAPASDACYSWKVVVTKMISSAE